MISWDDRPFIIAEAGTCHADPSPRRRLWNAMRYVDLAAEAGASAIKFQMFADPIERDMFCWIEGDGERSQRWELSSMPLDDWMEIKEAADEAKILLLASVFQTTTIQWANSLRLCATKVASRAAATFPYGRGPKPYIVSNGMAPTPDRPDVIGMECEANYPSTARWVGDLPGFSDHSGSPERALDAMDRGCGLVGVHFYDKPEDAGPDLPASLTTDELARVCEF